MDNIKDYLKETKIASWLLERKPIVPRDIWIEDFSLDSYQALLSSLFSVPLAGFEICADKYIDFEEYDSSLENIRSIVYKAVNRGDNYLNCDEVESILKLLPESLK